MMLRATSKVLKPSTSVIARTTAVRGMATEKDIRNRIVSTESIAKITKSMKMVAAAKLKGQQQRLDEGEAFGRLFTDAVHPAHDMEDVDLVPYAGKKHMIIAVTSDAGLCGGVNSSIIRLVKEQGAKLEDAGKDFKVFVIGDKGKSQMVRLFGDKTVCFVDQCYPRTGVTFPQASAIAARITAFDFDTASICYNHFRSAIKYDTVTRVLLPMMKDAEAMEAVKDETRDPTGSHLKKYDVDPDDKAEVLDNMFNFSIATTVYGCMLQNVVCEFSSRMNAMENASTNAADMIEKLRRKYNTIRQARITTELIEIISGAESLVEED